MLAVNVPENHTSWRDHSHSAQLVEFRGFGPLLKQGKFKKSNLFCHFSSLPLDFLLILLI